MGREEKGGKGIPFPPCLAIDPISVDASGSAECIDIDVSGIRNDPRRRSTFLALLGVRRAGALLNINHLTTTVLTTGWADVMWQLHRAAVVACDEMRGRDEVMSTAIALVGPANTLLWKCTHRSSSS